MKLFWLLKFINVSPAVLKWPHTRSTQKVSMPSNWLTDLALALQHHQASRAQSGLLSRRCISKRRTVQRLRTPRHGIRNMSKKIPHRHNQHLRKSNKPQESLLENSHTDLIKIMNRSHTLAAHFASFDQEICCSRDSDTNA